jgi:hypothetical protein
MSEKEKKEKEGALKAVWTKLASDRPWLNLWGKIASGAGVLTVLGYLFSWGFVTINSLQEKVAKLEQNRMEDKAQWGQILRISQESREHEIEIKVLQKLYDIRQPQSAPEKAPDRSVKDDEIRKLKEKLERLEKETRWSPEQFKNESIRQEQRIQKPLPKAK